MRKFIIYLFLIESGSMLVRAEVGNRTQEEVYQLCLATQKRAMERGYGIADCEKFRPKTSNIPPADMGLYTSNLGALLDAVKEIGEHSTPQNSCPTLAETQSLSEILEKAEKAEIIFNENAPPEVLKQRKRDVVKGWYDKFKKKCFK